MNNDDWMIAEFFHLYVCNDSITTNRENYSQFVKIIRKNIIIIPKD